MEKDNRSLSGQQKSHYVRIPGSERTPLPNAKKTGPVNPDEEMSVTVLIRRPPAPNLLENPDTSPFSLGRHFTREEFAAAHGANESDLEKVESFAHNHGLAVKEMNQAAGSILLSGTAAAFSKAFAVELAHFEHPEFTYRGRIGHVSIPHELADIIEAVLGLDERPQLKPHFQVFQEKEEFARANKRRKSYTPVEVAQLYNFPSNINCSEQCIGIIELGGGYNPAELHQYFSSLGVHQPNITNVSVNGATNQPTGDANGPDGEVALDIEIAGAVAPGVKIAVYFAPNTDAGFLNAITTAIHDTQNKPSVISISWGNAESQWTNQAMKAMDRAFQDAAAVGVTICCAAGDRGSSDGVDDGLVHVDFPASSPFALACGGTRLEGSGHSITRESVWNEGPDSSTGGGVSDVFDLPRWQSTANVPSSTNPGGRKGRGVPDVAGDADPATGYQILLDGQQTVIGGTSAVAPLWAGLIAIMNQQLGHPIGFINPTLYHLSTRGSAFHDITIGNNESSRGSGAYTAGPGWDACTGLGSPDGTNLIDALQSLNTSSGGVHTSDEVSVEQHPIFGHTLSNVRLPFHNNPLSLHGPLVHLKGNIKKVEHDIKFHGTSHYHLIVNQIQLISIKGADPSIVTDECFCAIRYGDKLGLGQPIEGLEEGQPIELQGEYIDKNHAYPSLGNPGDPVLHFTHHPVGFVIYKGKRYE